MSPDPRRHLGALGEDLAAQHLERRGFRVVDRNYRTRYGELDLIAYNGRILAFCEVKTRQGAAANPLEGIHPRKRAQVRQMARTWLHNRRDRPHAELLRFDAIGVTLDRAGRLVKLEHLEGAF